MGVEKVEVLVVGGGQAGIAMSEHLGRAGVGHLVLERARLAERWRSERWDSLVANGPAWHDRFPGMAFAGDPEAFVAKEAVADYLVDYAKKIDAPYREGVAVTRLTRKPGAAGFIAETSAGVVEAEYVVAATGPFQRPLIPPILPESAGVAQIHSVAYRAPDQLAPGAVLVVGSGSSGVQIAAELQEAGRKVYLSVGPHGRPPRRYRGRDFVWWLGVLNKWDAEATPGVEHTTIAVSGAHGGATVDFRALAAGGMVLLGRTEGFAGGKLTFAPDLAANITAGDANYLGLLAEADAYVARHGLDLPEEPQAHLIGPAPACMTDPVLSLDLAAAGITTVIWATGFGREDGWLQVGAFDAAGRPAHQRGVSTEPGVYFLGLPWQTRRGSSFIWGVWHDAKYIADHICKQRGYLAYRPAVSDTK
ncbi:FAD-dependent oxidoreductase [Rhodobacter xanthinilyticus]|uniref:FAD-dependent oxidoreductase n=1 Tax=Rhodobacter xanthinilyticus TaxID=1850250 RepID=A0A1D9MBR6_9RHOB|nr:NAD(P)/FAD-dependent oxidoreductase [Rhodobacter xanthinilyticus]AOZ69169.1 FAD-dependent oxidoreductase [Rhodobacter xanthinilyticus]